MRRHLHLRLYSQIKKIISIVKNLWIMEENKEAVQLTSSGKDGDFIWEDEQTILFVSERSEKKDDLEEKTTFYRINIHGGEAKQAFSVSRSVSFFKKLSDGLYCMGIEEIEIHFH